MIKILDCTLRDGGYINNWNFGRENAQNIISMLQKALIDYIEIGFITTEPSTNNQTLFDSFEKIKDFLPQKCDKSKLCAMITIGKFPISFVPDASSSPIGALRVIFKKNSQDEVLEYSEQIKEKGYKLFINPTFTDQYSDEEFISLLKKIEKINPYAVSVVDSMGVMKENDVIRLYHLLDNNLSRNIALCFHSHNNLQLSFSNAQSLIKICQGRELILDSTAFGMGRAAGVLSTELISRFLNEKYESNYDVDIILKVIEKYITPVFNKTPWGYSMPYYLSAINHCHPNYAKFLADRNISSVETINDILKSIPDDKKAIYDSNLIERIVRTN